MRTVTFDGRDVRIAATLRTLEIYEGQFGHDLMEVVGPAYEGGHAVDGGWAFDLARIPLLGCLRLFWAEAKTADPRLPSFDAWRATIGDSADVNVARTSWLSGTVLEASKAFLLDDRTGEGS